MGAGRFRGLSNPYTSLKSVVFCAKFVIALTKIRGLQRRTLQLSKPHHPVMLMATSCQKCRCGYIAQMRTDLFCTLLTGGKRRTNEFGRCHLWRRNCDYFSALCCDLGTVTPPAEDSNMSSAFLPVFVSFEGSAFGF